MKKTASRKKEIGGKPIVESSQNVDGYIATFPEKTQAILQKIRSMILHAAPEAGETIKYGIPTVVLRGNLVHFAAYKQHIGFYPTPSAIEHFKEQLSPYKTAKGSVQFPLDQAIPYALIEQIVQFRVAEQRQ